jgi:MFS family permease
MMPGFGREIGSLGPAFRALLLSNTISLLAVMVGHIATAWWIAHQGGGTDLALYAAILAAASLVSLPVLSPLGDRYCKRTLMVVSLAVLAAVAVALAVLAQFSAYHLSLIIGIDLVGAIAGALFLPASSSILPELLPAEQLTAGLALQKSGQALGRFVGPALGGGALAISGIAAALWLYAVLVLMACVLAMRIPKRSADTVGYDKKSQWLLEIRAGLAAKWHIKLERYWTFATFLFGIFLIPGIGMLLPMKIQSLNLSGAWLGMCEAALSIGMLTGSLGLSTWLTDRFGRFAAYSSAVIGVGICFAIIGSTHRPIILLGILAFVGICLATSQLVGQTHRMLAIPTSFRARMTSVQIMVMQIAGTIGPAVAGIGIDVLGIDRLYMIFGFAVLLVGIGYSAVPGYRAFIGMPHDAVKGHYGRTHPHIFS